MQRAFYKKICIALAGVACSVWYLHEPTPTMIALRIGQPFAEVVRNSSYPIMTESIVPSDQDDGFGATYVTEPSVVLQFNDPKHGFTLPPTTFLAITYMNGVVATVATSPMLKKLPFDQTVELLARLQDRFQSGGWQIDNGTHWFDLSANGRRQLHDYLRDPDSGWSEEAWLIVPKKYNIIFRIKCASRCDSRWGLDRYLIDIGIGDDTS